MNRGSDRHETERDFIDILWTTVIIENRDGSRVMRSCNGPWTHATPSELNFSEERYLTEIDVANDNVVVGCGELH